MKLRQKITVMLLLSLCALGAESNKKELETSAQKRIKINDIVRQKMATDFTAEKRIDLSGRQRMLSQRISELAIKIYLDIDAKDSKKLLVQTTKEFADALKKLKQSSQNDEMVLAKILEMENLWNDYIRNIKSLLFKGTKKQEGLRHVIENDEKLLDMSNDLVKTYKASYHSNVYLDKHRVAIIDMAGRQRMLTLKMLKEKMMILSGEMSYKKKLESTEKLFDASLNSMMHGNKKLDIVAPKNSEMINKLKEIQKHWILLRPMLDHEMKSKDELKELLKEFHVLLEISDQAVNISTDATEY